MASDSLSDQDLVVAHDQHTESDLDNTCGTHLWRFFVFEGTGIVKTRQSVRSSFWSFIFLDPKRKNDELYLNTQEASQVSFPMRGAVEDTGAKVWLQNDNDPR